MYGKSPTEHFAKLGNKIAKELSVDKYKVSPTVPFPAIAPWKLQSPRVDWFLLEIGKGKQRTVDLVSAFSSRIIEEYSGFIQIYTDGAKKPETGVTGIGVAVPTRGIGINRRTTDGLGVYTVEMVAILGALKWVEVTSQIKNSDML